MPRQSAAAFPSVTGAPPRLLPPSDLGPEEREVFCDLVASSEPDAFRPSDLPLLCAYVRAIVLERSSALEAGRDDKAMARWEKSVKAIVSLSMRLRLSPQSRAANNPSRPGSRPQRPLSVYEKMDLQEGDHDGSA